LLHSRRGNPPYLPFCPGYLATSRPRSVIVSRLAGSKFGMSLLNRIPPQIFNGIRYCNWLDGLRSAHCGPRRLRMRGMAL